MLVDQSQTDVFHRDQRNRPQSKARRVNRAIAGAVRPRTVNGPHKQNPEGVTETIAFCRPVGAWEWTDGSATGLGKRASSTGLDTHRSVT
jgi:hypothetical protein